MLRADDYDLIIIDSATSILAEDGAYHEDAAFTKSYIESKSLQLAMAVVASSQPT